MTFIDARLDELRALLSERPGGGAGEGVELAPAQPLATRARNPAGQVEGELEALCASKGLHKNARRRSGHCRGRYC